MLEARKRGRAAAAGQAGASEAAVRNTKRRKEAAAPAIAGAAAREQEPSAAERPAAQDADTPLEGASRCDSRSVMPARLGHSGLGVEAEKHAAGSGQSCGTASADGRQQQAGVPGQQAETCEKMKAAAEGVKPEPQSAHARKEQDAPHHAPTVHGMAQQGGEQAPVKLEGAAKLAAVEFLGDGCAQCRALGTLDLASCESYMCAHHINPVPCPQADVLPFLSGPVRMHRQPGALVRFSDARTSKLGAIPQRDCWF